MLPGSGVGLLTLLNFNGDKAAEKDNHGAVPSSRRKYLGSCRGTFTKVPKRNQSGMELEGRFALLPKQPNFGYR